MKEMEDHLLNNNLSSFTDILTDESQPISLSPEVKSQSCVNIPNANISNNKRPAKHTGQCGDFRSVDEIAEKYRCVFSYPFFNLVQSKIIEDALYSDKSFVVCAPTGSGKTVAFEMAIVQLLMKLEDMNYTDDFKIIYMAPVKAVCTERLTEWYPKFNKLGLLCIEVTGDTDVDFSKLKPYRIIITTPEKWDVLTRRWTDYRGLVGVIKLFLIDEVHILNDQSRGPVLEAVVSRMKTIESSAQSEYRIEQLKKQYLGTEHDTSDAPPRIRFVAVSATVSNPEDVAAWLGNSDTPAIYHKYGDECRPVKLKRIVEGYPCTEGTSIFKFDIILNYKLWPIIQKYYDGKPTLIFCNTRKSVALTAETLSRELTIRFNVEQRAKLTELASKIKNKKLQALVMNGVGCHHAGLLFEERINIEQAFRQRDLPVLITTTTLAMGVNLPAHLVIIKNTQQYVNGAYQEYSISTVLQMVGRAGRPQFDTEATAVIMTRMQDKLRYQSLVGGSEPLQSYLHKRLTENLNSEAALHTVTDVAQCVQWMRSTFLYVRAARDPKRYLGLPAAAPLHLIMKKIEELCVKAMNGLASSGLITMDEASCIESTEAGRLMSIYYLDFETMKHIMKIDGTETLERLLWVVCESHELAEMHLRVDERRCLNTLNRNNAAATIRFPMKGKISTRQMKLNCVIQATLGCLSIPDPSLNQESMKIMRIADRICKCMVSYITRSNLVSQQPQYYSAILNSIILAKCIAAHLWDNSPYVSKQLKGIGPTFSTLLATAGKINFMLLEESHPRDLERIMNKGPPAGNVLRKQISLLPKYQLTLTPIDEKCVSLQLMLLNQGNLMDNMDQLTAGEYHKSYLIVGDSENHILLFISFTDKDLITIYDGIITRTVVRKHRFEHKVFVHCVSSSFVGIDVQCEYLYKDLDPKLPPSENNGVYNLPCKSVFKRQTNITDTFKERKRKNNENDITQSKEKKKRENSLIEKFKCLKKSFGNTSKELKDDLNKSENYANNTINKYISSEEIQKDLKSYVEIVNTPINETQNKENQNISNAYAEDVKSFDTEFSENELFNFSYNAQPNLTIHSQPLLNEINDNVGHDGCLVGILNKIECEIMIKSKENSNNMPEKDPNKYEGMNHELGQSNNFPATSAFDDVKHSFRLFDKSQSTDNITNDERSELDKTSSYKNNKHSQNKVAKKVNNFSFIELLERNVNFSDEEENCKEKSDSGFSEAIKGYVQKYLCETKEVVPQFTDAIKRYETKTFHNSDDLESDTYKNIKRDEMQNQITTFKENDSIKNNSSIKFDMENYQNILPIESSVYSKNYTNSEPTSANLVVNKNIIEKSEEFRITNHDESENCIDIENASNCINRINMDTSEQHNFSNVQEIFSNHSTKYELKENENLDKNVMIYDHCNLNNKLTHIQENTKLLQSKSDKNKDQEMIYNTKNKITLFDSDLDIMQNSDLLETKESNDRFKPSEKSFQGIVIPQHDKHDFLFYQRNISNTGLIPLRNKYKIDINDLKFDKTLGINRLTNNNRELEREILCLNQTNNIINKKLATQNTVFLKNFDADKITKNHIPLYTDAISLSSNTGETNGMPKPPNYQVTHTQYSYTSTEIDVWSKIDKTSECRLRVTKKMMVDVDISKTKLKEQKSFNNEDHEIDQFMNASKYNEIEENYESVINNNKLPSTETLCYDNLNLNLPNIQNTQFNMNNAISSETKEPNITAAVDENNKPNNVTAQKICTEQKKEESKSSEMGISAVDSLLNKYINIFKDKAETVQTSRSGNQINSSNEKSTQPLKQIRPFRISDIHTVNAVLPKNIVDTVHTSTTTSIFNYDYMRACDNDDITETYSSPDERLSDVEEISNNTSQMISTLMDTHEDSDSENKYNIDQSMLNPKTLLQCCMNKEDDGDIVPPPPQFCDNTISEFSKSYNILSTYPESNDISFCNDNNYRNDTDYLKMNEKKIETWTLLAEDKNKPNEFLIKRNPKSYTVMRNHHESPHHNKIDVSDKSERKVKLGQFKFHTKSKFRVRR